MNRTGRIILILFLGYSSFFKCQGQVVDSLLLVLKTTIHDTTKLTVLVAISDICSEEDIQKYSRQALKLAGKLKSSANKKIQAVAKKKMADALNNMAFRFQTRGEIDSALIYNERSLAIRKQINNNDGIGESLINIGYLLEQKGDISQALENYHEAITYYELANSKRGLAYAFNNIGFIYQKLDNLNKALEYYIKSKALRQELEDKHGLSQSLTNIGAIYKLQKNYKKSLETHFKSLEIQLALEDQSGISNSYNNIGYIYENDNDLNKALNYYQKSFHIREKIHEKKGMANSLSNIGRIYLLKKDYHNSLIAANRSYILSKELGFPENIKNSSKLLSVLFKKQSKFRESVDMLEEFIKMNDSITNQSLRKNTAKQQLQYEFGKRAIADSVKHDEEQKVKDAQINAQQAEIEKDQSKKTALYGGLLLVLIFASFMFNRFRVTQRQKVIIENQKKNVELQKAMVDQKQKEIVDSINYAKRIQEAMLKDENHTSMHLPPHFILYLPKDIVSGDFYWAMEKDNFLYLAVADCTGHGVPGAFLTLLGTSFLNEITLAEKIYTPAIILNLLRAKIIKELSNNGQSKDGMDISLIRIDLKTYEAVWAGAFNPLWILKNKSDLFIEIKADKQPIGYSDVLNDFNDNEFQLEVGDQLYLFTDGFADQFGGAKGKKFKYKQMQGTLLQLRNDTMEDQKKQIVSVFEDWRGNLDQVDDILLLGIKIGN